MQYISIHVPTRGTTPILGGTYDESEVYFNPRAHEGHDQRCVI